MRSFDKLAYRLARALLAFVLAPARAVGEQFWQALRAPKDKNDRGWLPAIVRLVARLTALAGAVILPADALLFVFPHLTQSHLAKLVFGGFFAAALPAALVGFGGLVVMLVLLVALALASAIGAYRGDLAPRDGVTEIKALRWRAVPLDIAVIADAFSRGLGLVGGAAVAILTTFCKANLSMVRMRLRRVQERAPAAIRARTIAHVCLSSRLLAQRPNSARSLRAATSTS